jgi:hypothetical protein
MHNGDVRTTERGLLERVFFHKVDGNHQQPFKPAYDDVKAMLGDVRNRLLRNTWFIAPYTVKEFIDCYVGRKKSTYERARDSLVVEPVTTRDAELETFVKAEKLNLSTKTDPTPRIIQPRNPRFNLSLGVYIRPCEKMLYKAINRLWGGKTVMKGLNADERGKAIAYVWNSYRRPVGIGVDASRFDQHVSEALLKFEHSVYNAIFKDAELRRLLRMQLVNKGRAICRDGMIKYETRGKRCSGDMNTSLGNVLLMCLMMKAYCETKDFTVSLINDGDDCILITERENVGRFEDMGEWFGRLGMVMTVEEPIYELEGIEFCQSHPVLTNGGTYRMVRDPRVCLTKDVLVVKPVLNKSDYQFYRRAIGLCGKALAGDMPVFWEFYQTLIRGTDNKCMRNASGVKRAIELQTGMQFLALRMTNEFISPTTACRVSFAKAFGIEPDFQLALEKLYRETQLEYNKIKESHELGELIAGCV